MLNQLKPFEPITYPFEQQPATGEALELAPGVRWLRMPLPFELNHINLWLLEEADGWTIVDTGLNLDDIKRHWETVLEAHCREKPVKRIIVTHCHPDHLGLARWLGDKLGVDTWITQGEMLNAYAWFHQLPNFDVDGMVGFFRRHGLDPARADLLHGRGTDLSRPRQRPADANTAVSWRLTLCASATTTGASSSATATRPSMPRCIAPN